MTSNNLISKTLDELRQVAAEVNLKPFAAQQIAQWLYAKRAADIMQMTNISLTARKQLAQKYAIEWQQPTATAVSTDGTRKYIFPTTHGTVETVFIPEGDRATLCVSIQVGCKMNCTFCMTGRQGWSGNLTAAEILNQILMVPESEQLTNIVFMGMGEPFDNTDALLRAINVITSPWGLGWSPHRITVSTVGLVPGMTRFLEACDCHLAVSLHNPLSKERLSIMPVEKVFPLERVLATLRRFDFTHQRRLSFEYIVFEGLNNMPRHLTQLVHLLHDIPCRVNLIRWHALPDIDLHSPDEAGMEAVRNYLNNNGIVCTIRRSRGEDIAAACGLLCSEQKKKNA